MKVLRSNFSHDAFHIVARQTSQNIILHQILDIYPHIRFITKGLLIVQKMHV